MESVTHIEIDLDCAGCGYNLRTLSRDGICPECTRPVRDSMGGWGPVLQSRAAVLKLRRWIGLYVTAVIASALLGFIFRGWAFYSEQLRPYAAWSRQISNYCIIGGDVLGAVAGLAIVLICFNCASGRKWRYRILAWCACFITLSYYMLSAAFYIGLYVDSLDAMKVMTFPYLQWSIHFGAIQIVGIFLNIMVLSVINRATHPWIFRLFLAAVIAAMIQWFPNVAVDIPVELGFESLLDDATVQSWKPSIFSGSGILEALDIVQMIAILALVRALRPGDQA